MTTPYKTCEFCARSLEIKHFERLGPGKFAGKCNFCIKVAQSVAAKKARLEAEKNREQSNVYYLENHKPRARRYARERFHSDGTVTKIAIAKMRLDAVGQKCPYCWKVMEIGKEIQIDHIWPISKRGRHSIHAMLACCRSCNLKKRDTTPDLWLDMLPRKIAASVLRIYEERADIILEIMKKA